LEEQHACYSGKGCWPCGSQRACSARTHHARGS
jgi:hypothetical protein